MHQITMSELKNELGRYAQIAQQTNQPIIIKKNRRPYLVIMSYNTYQADEQTNRLTNFRDSLKNLRQAGQHFNDLQNLGAMIESQREEL